MKLLFMKQSALDYIKANIKELYINYYREETNKWIYDLFEYDPFEVFIDLPDFDLAPLSDKKGQVDVENCKIIYSKMMNVSESQASDERLWAGLCNGTFYAYMRKRWDYDKLKLKDPAKDASAIVSRYFFSGGVRAGCYRNTLSKCWWVGHNTYRNDLLNKFELLDAIGTDDFVSKVSELFYSNNFSSNKNITEGICRAWKAFKDKGIKLSVKDYFRPALQYMNALGGAILLDSLSAEEIENIFFEFIYNKYYKLTPEEFLAEEDNSFNEADSEEIYSGIEEFIESIEIKDDDDISDEDPVYDYSDVFVVGEERKKSNSERKLNKILNTSHTIGYGSIVIVENETTSKKIKYNIPNANEESLPIHKKLLNKKLEDRVFLAGNYYKILSIE